MASMNIRYDANYIYLAQDRLSYMARKKPLARDAILQTLSDGAPYKLGLISETVGITKPYAFTTLRELVSLGIVKRLKHGTYQIVEPNDEAVRVRLKAEQRDRLLDMRARIDEMIYELERF